MNSLVARPSAAIREDWPLCVDGRMMDAQPSGVTSYAQTLYGILRSHDFDPLLLNDGGSKARRSKPAKWLAAARLGIRRLSWEEGQLMAPDIFREAQVHFNLYGRPLALDAPGPSGLVHWTYPCPLHILRWKNVYTVHDAIPLTNPDLTSISRRRHERMLRVLAQYADRIVTVSDAARQEIANCSGIAIGQIVNLSQAVDVVGNSTGGMPAGLQPGGYFLFTGTIEVRKNVERLVAAHMRSGTSVPLVVVGEPGWGSDAALAQIKASPNAIHLPHQPRSALLHLMRNARALLFPSLAEGFGLPIAEAMALGVPVMTSTGGATEETAGGAACLVDPIDVEAMTRTIARLAVDDDMCSSLRNSGLARAPHFNADAYAERLRAFYNEVVDG